MTPEVDIKISLTSMVRIDCSGQIVRRKEQFIISGEILSWSKRFFLVVDQFVYFQIFKYIRIVSNKREVYLPELVLVPKRQPGK